MVIGFRDIVYFVRAEVFGDDVVVTKSGVDLLNIGADRGIGNADEDPIAGVGNIIMYRCVFYKRLFIDADLKLD